MIFSLFFGIFSADANTLFAALYTPLDGGGELVFDEGEDDPLQPHLESPSSQSVTRQV